MAYQDYSQAFQGAEQKYGLPSGTLGGIGYVESRYNPQAVSPKGAKGLMQFMPATAKNLGLSDPFDPNASIDAAGNLMHQNLAATHGNLANALMMYNAGTNPNRWQPSYAEQVQARMQPPQPQPGGQPQMPPQTGPMSLADLQNTPPMQSQAPSLGALAQSMPQGNIPAPHHSKFNLGNIAGVLGDAFSAYGGKQPTFGPFLQAEQMRKQEQDFEMQKFNNELALKMYMMRNGGMETDVGKKLMGEGIYPGDPRWVTAMQTSANNDLDPVVTTPQGLMLRSQITGAMAGAPAPQGVTFTPIGGN